MRKLLVATLILAWAHSIQAAEERKPATLVDLLAQLSRGNLRSRHQAVVQIGNLGLAARDAVPILGKLLHDPFAELHLAAAKSLAQIGQPAAGELIKALKDRNPDIRKLAAHALAQAGSDDKEAVPALIEALKDKNSEVRAAVIDALGEMGAEGKEAASPLAQRFHDSSVRVRQHVGQALSKIGLAAVEPLCDALGEDKAEVRLDAIKTIGLFGPLAKNAVPALRKAMKDDDHRIRAAAAEALGKMGIEAADAVPELLDALKDKKREVHRKTANALVLLTMAGVPDLLEKVRKAESKEAWLAPALQINMAIKDANPLSPLLKDLGHKEPQVRCKAALTLGSIGPAAQSAVPSLTRVLTDENVQVRLGAAMAIARIQRGKVEVNLAVRRVLREIQDELDDLRTIQGIANVPGGQGGDKAQGGPHLMTPQQAYHFIMTYIVFKTTLRGYAGSAFISTIQQRMETILQMLQEEAVFGLVTGINYIAMFDLGDC